MLRAIFLQRNCQVKKLSLKTKIISKLKSQINTEYKNTKQRDQKETITLHQGKQLNF